MKLILLALPFLLIGCGQPEYIYQPKEVYIPTKCDLPMPERPILDKNSTGVKELAIYAEELECTLHKCRGEVCKK